MQLDTMGERGRPKRNFAKISATDLRFTDARNTVMELFVSPEGVRIEEPTENITMRNTTGEQSSINSCQAVNNGKLKTHTTTLESSSVSHISRSKMAEMNSKIPNTNVTVPCKSSKAENPKDIDQMKKASGIQSWANVVVGNKFASRGMNLQYITPMIQDGEKIVQLDLEDVEQENEK